MSPDEWRTLASESPTNMDMLVLVILTDGTDGILGIDGILGEETIGVETIVHVGLMLGEDIMDLDLEVV